MLCVDCRAGSPSPGRRIEARSDRANLSAIIPDARCKRCFALAAGPETTDAAALRMRNKQPDWPGEANRQGVWSAPRRSRRFGFHPACASSPSPLKGRYGGRYGTVLSGPESTEFGFAAICGDFGIKTAQLGPKRVALSWNK